MKLFTKEIIDRLTANPLCSHEYDEDPPVICKIFNPYGLGTWYITEGSLQPDGDWVLFGLCCITEMELGYVLLSQLEEITFYGCLTLERDLYFSGTLSKAREEMAKVYN